MPSLITLDRNPPFAGGFIKSSANVIASSNKPDDAGKAI